MTTASTRTTGFAPMSTERKHALAAGLFYLATFAFSIPALAFYHDVLNDPAFVLQAGNDGGILWGAAFEVITGLTAIGTAVALYPVIKRHGPSGAIGFVASRTLEAAIITIGIIGLLAVYSLRQDFGGTDTVGLATTASALVAVHDWSFLLGPGIMPAVNALCLAPILYRARLVPRALPVIGLVGAVALVASSMATLFGAYDQVSSVATLTALPIAAWEFSIGVYFTVKGFQRPAAADASPEPPVVERQLVGTGA